MISWRSFALVCFNMELWSIQAYKTVKTSNIIGVVSVLLIPWLMSFSDGLPLLYYAVDGLWTPIIFGLKFGFCTTCTYFASWPRKKYNYKAHCTNDCKRIMIYFAEIFILQHTDQTRTKNKQIVYSNLREKTSFFDHQTIVFSRKLLYTICLFFVRV